MVTNSCFNNIYLLNPDIQFNLLFDAIGAYLNKLEALTAVAATIDFEAYTSEIINNYLWELSDIAHETKLLYENAIKKLNHEAC